MIVVLELVECLSVAEEYLHELNPDARLEVFWAGAKS
jgi:hypothetical protein